jgi:hypothetical protein
MQRLRQWLTIRNLVAATAVVALGLGGSVGVYRLSVLREGYLERARRHAEVESFHLGARRLSLQAADRREAPPYDPGLPDLSVLMDGRPLDSGLKELLRLRNTAADGRSQDGARERERAARFETYAAYHSALKDKYLRAAARPWITVEPDPPPPEPRSRVRYWLRRGDYVQALAAHEDAARDEPDDPGMLNNLAWFLATCPNDRVRDGRRAVALATEACELGQWADPNVLDTLAAAHAEAGDFKAAVETQREATRRLMPVGRGQDDFFYRLRLYQSGKPYREENANAL